MQALLKIFYLMAVISLVAGCDKTDEFFDTQDVELKSAQVMVTVPFKANFVGNYLEGTGPNSMCGEWDPANGLFWGIVLNDGEGNATHLGKFTHHFEFCCDFASGIYPGPTGHMEGYFVSANGDKLFVSVAGQVLNGRLDHHPADVNSYFTDPWEIIGGTGRFEGATGSGMTDDYNRDSYPDNSFHHWTGTITMVKGKK